MTLTQLPETGDWVDLAIVNQVVAEPDTTHPNSAFVIVHTASKIHTIPTLGYEAACTLRDEIAKIVSEAQTANDQPTAETAPKSVPSIAPFRVGVSNEWYPHIRGVHMEDDSLTNCDWTAAGAEFAYSRNIWIGTGFSVDLKGPVRNRPADDYADTATVFDLLAEHKSAKPVVMGIVIHNDLDLQLYMLSDYRWYDLPIGTIFRIDSKFVQDGLAVKAVLHHDAHARQARFAYYAKVVPADMSFVNFVAEVAKDIGLG